MKLWRAATACQAIVEGGQSSASFKRYGIEFNRFLASLEMTNIR